MNYVVVVLEPVPHDVRAVAQTVSERFKISLDKATALVHRAPGAVTKAVPEQQAMTVAGILSEAGLLVEIREGDADGRALPLFAAAGGAAAPDDGGSVAGDRGVGSYAHDGFATASGLRTTATDAGHAAEATRSATAVEERTYQPLGAVEVGGRSSFDDPEDDADDADDGSAVGTGFGATAGGRTTDGGVAASVRASGVTASVTATGTGAREVPEAGHTTTTPPRDPMKTTLTREPPDLERSGLRRRIGSAATLPALLTLVVTLLALAVTLLPVLRNQQLRRAADGAQAVAATLEGLSGGLPLSAPMIRAELRLVEERTRQQLAPRGVSFMTVMDADGTPLLAWDTAATTTASLSPEASAAARAAAEQVGAGATATVLDSLRSSFATLKAMVGLGSEQPVVAAAVVRRNGQVAGTVAVGLDPGGLRAELGQVLLTTLLVGLIPVLFAVLAALSLTRGLTGAIRYLLVAADRISHGDLERPVELQRDDELGQIAKAVERMRLSLYESMERLRRRR